MILVGKNRGFDASSIFSCWGNTLAGTQTWSAKHLLASVGQTPSCMDDAPNCALRRSASLLTTSQFWLGVPEFFLLKSLIFLGFTEHVFSKSPQWDIH